MKALDRLELKLRRSQIALAATAGGMIFLPWSSRLVNTMQGFQWETVTGISSAYGSLALVLLLASMGTSILELRINRSARFVHVGLFSATILMGIIFHSIGLIPASVALKVRPEFDIFITLALIFFATSAMLSPSNEVDGKKP